MCIVQEMLIQRERREGDYEMDGEGEGLKTEIVNETDRQTG